MRRKYGIFNTYRILTTCSLIMFSFHYISAQHNLEEIQVGADLTKEYFPLLKNKSIAVVGNQTSIVGKLHLVDTLLLSGLEIKKVFAPEHGFRGTADAGEKVKNGKDLNTGLPILSLYGKNNRKPSEEVLKDIDVILFDIQDVGVRFYTYISSMHYVMQACAEQNKLLIILDRPNPNGHYVDGPILKKGNESFIGLHPVPIVHGMTIGEYAQMINGEKWLKGGLQCPLIVIKCKNYNHSDYYELPVKPSPNLPNMTSIYLYPSLCLFEGTNVSVGRGTEFPFQIFGSPYLESTGFSFTPKSIPGAKNPKHKGAKCKGYELHEFGNEYLKFKGTLYLDWLINMYKETKDKAVFFRSDGFFRLLTGDESIRRKIEEGKTAKEIWLSFQKEVEEFKQIRIKYLLYPDFE